VIFLSSSLSLFTEHPDDLWLECTDEELGCNLFASRIISTRAEFIILSFSFILFEKLQVQGSMEDCSLKATFHV
jgi:hypothetical protein